MSEELDVLKTVCQRLDQAKVAYMLTGSFAANFYAVPRMTRDLDIVVEIQEADIDNLWHLFQEDFYLDKDAISEAIKHQGMFNIIHNATVFKIDFIVRKNSAYRSIEFQRKQRVLLHGIPVWIVAPEDLIISKLFWAKDSFSEMQLKDIRNLFTSLKNLDSEYIQKWVDTLKLKTIYERINSP